MWKLRILTCESVDFLNILFESSCALPLFMLVSGGEGACVRRLQLVKRNKMGQAQRTVHKRFNLKSRVEWAVNMMSVGSRSGKLSGVCYLSAPSTVTVSTVTSSLTICFFLLPWFFESRHLPLLISSLSFSKPPQDDTTTKNDAVFRHIE